MQKRVSANNSGYMETHREEIKIKQRVKVTCECGCEVSYNHLSEHRKTQKHINLMKEKESLNGLRLVA